MGDHAKQRDDGGLVCGDRIGKAAVSAKAAKPAKKPRKATSGQKEMLMSIEGKKPAKEAAAKKPASKPQRKSA
jgi:DNA end-binding protein Ku